MLNMSTYYGTMDRSKLAEFIKTTDKPIVYTFGFEWKNPTIRRVEKTINEALEIVRDESWLEAEEEEEVLHLHGYSENDMW